jgi:hypothetical protein
LRLDVLIEPNFSHVLRFESVVGNRENAATWFERNHCKILAERGSKCALHAIDSAGSQLHVDF